MSNEDRWILLNAIMQYQNWLDPWELPYAVKIVFAHIKNFFIEQEKKYEEIKEKRSESGKKWGRPTTGKAKKANAFSEKQTKTKKSKQKLTETDTVTDTDTIISLPSGRENTSNEVLGLDISSTSFLNNIKAWQDSKKFWNIEIDEVLEMVASINEGAMDGTQARNRQFANLLLKKIKAMPRVECWAVTWQSVLTMIIELNKDDEYHAGKLSSPEKIFRNFGTLVGLARTKFQQRRKNSDWVF